MVHTSTDDNKGEAMSVESTRDDDDDSGDFAAPPLFLPDDRVLCKDNNNDQHYYESIVRKVKCVAKTGEWNYYVHYQGWNSRWDRWATMNDIVEDTPEMREKYLNPTKEALQKAQRSDSAPTASSNDASTSTNVSPPPKKRRTTESKKRSKATSLNSNATQKRVIYYQDFCELPFTLRTVLIDEYHIVTRRGFDSPHYPDVLPTVKVARSVHQLPAAVTVKQVLSQYQKKRGGPSEEKNKQQQIRRFCNGLASLFDDALPVCLLYPEEIPQYQAMDLQGQHKGPSEVYGCEFLLRLYMRLPILLDAEPTSEIDTNGPLLADLLVLLQKNRQACFKATYREPASDELMDREIVMIRHARQLKKDGKAAKIAAEKDTPAAQNTQTMQS